MDIWKSKIDGPYLFKLDIYSHTRGSTLTTHLEGLTGNYTYDQFEKPIPDLWIGKNGLSTIKQGGEMDYTICYGNCGDGDGSNVAITDILPASVTYISDTSGLPVSGTETGTITWDVGTLTPWFWGGFNMVVKVNDNATGSLVNTIQISTQDTEITYENNTSTCQTEIVEPEVNLVISKSGPWWNPAPTNEFDYTIYYINYGNIPANNVVITDFLPGSVTYISDTFWGTKTIYQGSITYHLDRLEPYCECSFNIKVRINPEAEPGEELVNNAFIFSDECDINLEDNEATCTTYIASPVGDMVIGKWGSNEAIAGEETGYWIWYINQGNVAVENVTITDYLPSGTTYLRDTSGLPVSTTTETIMWYLGTITPGQSGWFDPTLSVSPYLSGSTTIANVVQIQGSPTLGNDPDYNNWATFTSHINQPFVDLWVKKYGPEEAISGKEITYVLFYRNDWNVPATNVAIVDLLPEQAEFVKADGNLYIENGTITWHLGNVTPGWDNYLYLTVKVSPETQGSTTLINRVVISADNEGNISNNQGSCSTHIIQPVINLRIEKFGPKEIGEDEFFEYTIYYRNTGGIEAEDVTIVDLLPAGVTYWGDTFQGYKEISQGKATYYVGNLNPSLQPGSFKIKVRPQSGFTGTLTNVVHISGIGTETVLKDNWATVTTQVESPNIDLAVHKQGPEGIAANNEMVYHIWYQNKGNVDAENVLLTDNLPSGTTYSNDNSGFFANITDTRITWSVGQLSPLESGYFKLWVKVTDEASGALINTIEISSPVTDTNISDNVATVTTQVEEAITDLWVAKWGPEEAASGQEFWYHLALGNMGNSQVNDVSLIDTLDSKLKYLSDTSGITPVFSDNLVIWKIPCILPGQSRHFKMRVRVCDSAQGSDTLTNKLEIAKPSEDPNSANNTSERSIHIVDKRPDIAIYKWTAGARPGFDMCYHLTYENKGTDRADNVVVTDRIDPILTYLWSTLAGLWNATERTLSWNIGSIEAGQSGDIVIWCNLSPTTPLETELHNKASISTTSNDGDLEDNYLHLITIVRGSIDPNDKLQDKGFVGPGGEITYTIRFENQSSATANAQLIKITDQLDPSLDWNTFAAGKVSIGTVNYDSIEDFNNSGRGVLTFSYDHTTGSATWSFDFQSEANGLPPNHIPPEGEGWVMFKIKATSTASSGTEIQNIARIQFDFATPIDTPATLAIVDSTLPTSLVSSQDISTSTTFLVRWTGSDTAGGTEGAISKITIYSSDSGGSYTSWYTETFSTPTTTISGERVFAGSIGHTYSFYSEATDVVGNSESAPSTPDAKTTVYGEISGFISYSGAKVGTIGVFAMENLEEEGMPTSYTLIPSSGSYTLLVGTPGSYYITSFMDSEPPYFFGDENPFIFGLEPLGWYGTEEPATITISQDSPIATVNITLIDPATITLSKSTNKDDFLPGELCTYTITYSCGEGYRYDFRIEDDLPKGLVYFTSTPPGAYTATHTLYWDGDLGSQPSGTYTIVLQIPATATVCTYYTNTITFYTNEDTIGTKATASVAIHIYDPIPPVISRVIEPASNTYLSGTITIKLEVQDNESGIDKVELWVGTMTDCIWGTDTDRGILGTMTINLDTTKYPDGVYNLCCVAIDFGQNRATSTISYPVTIDNTKPAIPTLISVTNPALDGRLNLLWTQGTDTNLAGYKIHIGTQTGTYTSIIDTGSTLTTHTLGSLTNGTCYYINISAIDKAGNDSGLSNELSGIPTGPPASITVSSVAYISADIAETNIFGYVTDVSGYPITGVTVFWTSNGTLSSATSTTSQGTATVVLLTSKTAGSTYTVTGTISTAQSSSGIIVGSPAIITLTAPDTVSADLATATISAYITDAYNNPATTTVFWTSNGSLSSDTSTTSQGTATVVLLTSKTAGSTYTVTGTITGAQNTSYQNVI